MWTGSVTWVQRLVALSRRMRDLKIKVQRFRGPLTVVSLALLIAGGWISFRHLDVSLDRLAINPLLVQLAITPFSLLFGGVGLKLLARSAGANITLAKATIISTYASLAEALPVPGGAVIRAGALMSSGVRLGQSSLLVLFTAILWISLAALGCGIALWNHGAHGAILLVLIGAAGGAGVFGWLVRTASLRLALLTLLHRLSGMVLITIRLSLAFLTIGVVVAPVDILPFVLANIAGTAASIAPAGLGISEAFAAVIATSVKVAPTAAFLAVGIDRLFCLGASALFALISMRLRREDALAAATRSAMVEP